MLYLIKFFTEAKVCENYMTTWVQQNILKFQVAIDNPKLQQDNYTGARETQSM